MFSEEKQSVTGSVKNVSMTTTMKIMKMLMTFMMVIVINNKDDDVDLEQCCV